MEISRVVVAQSVIGALLMAHGLVEVFPFEFAIQLEIVHAGEHGGWESDGRAGDGGRCQHACQHARQDPGMMQHLVAAAVLPLRPGAHCSIDRIRMGGLRKRVLA